LKVVQKRSTESRAGAISFAFGQVWGKPASFLAVLGEIRFESEWHKLAANQF